MRPVLRCLTSSVAVLALVTAARPREAESQRVRCGTRSTPPCTAPGTFTQVSAGQSHSCGIGPDQSAWCWGDGRLGALADGRRAIERLPQRVGGSRLYDQIAAGGDFTCARSIDHELYCWGKSQAVPGWPEVQDAPVRVPVDVPVQSVTAGLRHACVIGVDQVARCWGWNVDGETGTGAGGIDNAMVAIPTPVATDRRFTMLSAGMGFTCGATVDGEVLCWGSNVDGIIGREAPERCADVTSVPCATRPVAVALPARAIQVSSGTGHACAVVEGGAAYCWGGNASGQVGSYRPGMRRQWPPARVPVDQAVRFTSVASGGIHTCALASSGAAYCWGADQLTFGDEIEPSAVAPRVMAEGTAFRAIAAGPVHACALDTRGRVHCWGDTIRGALGIR